MNTVTEPRKAAELKAAWEELKKNKPTLRIRDCAVALGVSEAELLATTVGEYTTRLEGNWTEFLQRLPGLGRVMSLTRNESCVLEHKGPFQKIDIIPAGPHVMATVIGPIESRVFFAAWKYGFAVQQPTPHGLQQSLQIFDEAGIAVTKVFLLQPGTADNKPGSNQDAYDRILAEFKAKDQATEVQISAVRTAPTKSIDQVDKEALIADWEKMQDTHDFFGMIRKHQVNRLDAVKLADGKFCYRIENTSLQTMLERSATEQLPIMVFAGNRGNLQIHQGKVQTIRVMDQWLNVLDPDFNMHLRADHVDSVWVVKKPTVDGVVTGIEVFDKNKEMIVQFFGLRKPGISELERWRALVNDLPRVGGQ